jgi:tetratricopeptide (TPR) repeat protein
VLIGRDVVLAACDVALTGAVAGRGRLVLVAGEAGIGKSTVVQAVADRGTAVGAVVRWGVCWEGGTLLPFGVWLDCLRRPGADACAAVAERLERGDIDIGTDAAAAERARLRFFTEVVDALREVSSERPQVVVFEDIHWADTGSLQLLGALAPHLPTLSLLAVATYRDEEIPAGSPLAGLGGLGGAAERLGLEGLDEGQVAALLSHVLGRAASPDEARTVHRETGGNPLFVTQVGRLLATGSAAVLPAGVRDVLARRLARVSATCDQVLGVGAVLGTEFDVAVVAAVLDAPEERIFAALDEAAAARLVAPVEGSPDRWGFVHALVRTARYEALGTTERTGLHRRVTDVLEARRVPAGVLAYHAARALFETGDGRPAGFAVAAAREALGRFAWDEAAVLCRRALEVAPAGAAGDELRAEAWLGLGDARLRTGDDAAAADAFGAAAAVGRASDRPELLARAALGIGAGFGGFEVRLLDRRQLELLEEAVRVLPADSPFRPLVLARLSVSLSFMGSEQRRLELADEAVGLSRRFGDGPALAAALAARCDVLAGPDHVGERLDAASEIVALAQRAGDLPLELLGRRLRVVALLELRDLTGFDAEVSAYARAAERLADPLYGWYVPLWKAMRAHADGRLDEAVRLGDEARAIGVSGGSMNAEILRLILGMFVALDRRDATGLDAEWAEMVAKHPQLFLQEAAAAMVPFIDARFGRAGRARGELNRVGHDLIEHLPRDQEWLTAIGQILVAGVVSGENTIVRRTYELLVPYAGLGVFEGAAAVDHGVVDRFLALAAGCLGDIDAARRHVEAALVASAGCGRLVVAHTRADCARAMLYSTHEHDLHRGKQLARAAIEDYEALELAPLAGEMGALVAGQGDCLAGASAPAAALVREGETWAFTFDGTTVRVRHAKGVADLAVLLARPGAEVHVRTLTGVDDVGPRSSTQAALDQTAVAQYRQRLRDLEGDLDEADRHGDLSRAERLVAERDALVDQLTKAFGLGGRARSAGSDPDERLRKAVSARVKASIDRLERLNPVLGRHLRNSIRTGFWCSYQPEQAISWEVPSTRSG